MIIHCYFTNGLLYYGKLLLETFKFHNGDDIKFVLTTRDLNEREIGELRKIYRNLDIINEPLNYDCICKDTQMNKKELLKAKHEIETHSNRKRSPNLVKWKQYISVQDRYRNSIIKVMNKYKNEDFLVHFDADMYIRKPLDDLFELVSNNDFTIIFRLYSKKDWQKVFGCLLGVKLNKRGFRFMNVWRQKIDDIPFSKQPFAYGQTSCYLAYEDLKNNKNFKWGHISEKYVGKNTEQSAAIWSGNKPGKIKNSNEARKDFNRIKSHKIKPKIIKI